MPAFTAPVAAVQLAVRRTLPAVPSQPGDTVLVACSGGPDSLALAAATAFVAPRLGVRAGLVTVDHQLQPGSAQRADEVAQWARDNRLAPVLVERVEVAGRPGGPEAAAREARYEALCRAARDAGAVAVLLGHTRDDQAETVLLALARGAGPRGLAGMPATRVIDGVLFLRPFLDIPRESTHQACEAWGLKPWHDPHNVDPAYTRSRVRAALPELVKALGPGTVANLARTARLLAEDTELLDALAEKAAVEAADGEGLSAPALAAMPAALRGRVLHRFARTLGASGSALSSRHIDALGALVTDWHGQGPVALPGGIEVARRGSRLERVADFPA